SSKTGRSGQRPKKYGSGGAGLIDVLTFGKRLQLYEHVDTVVDPQSQQQRQGDDVGKINGGVGKHGAGHRKQAGQDQRRHDQRGIQQTAPDGEQYHRDGNQGNHDSLLKSLDDFLHG